MPNEYLTEAIKEAYMMAPSDDVIIDTLEISHPAWVDPGTGDPLPLRVTNQREAVIAWLEATAPLNPGEQVTFAPYPFTFRKPHMDPSSLPEVEIEIDNVSADIIKNIEIAMQNPEKIRVIYRPYLSSDLNGPHFNPPMTLWATNINADIFTITMRATFGDMFNKSFPSELYTIDRFPGLLV